VSNDGTNWYSLVIDETTTISEISERQWQMSEGALSVLVDIGYLFTRVSLKETGVAANAGTATVEILLSGL
jgi:hypothetical protein